MNKTQARVWAKDVERLAAAEKRVELLEIALRQFGKHAPDCAIWRSDAKAGDCDCGLMAVLAGRVEG